MRILHDAADLAGHEICQQLVGGRIDARIGIRRTDAEAALRPAALEFALAVLFRLLQGQVFARFQRHDPDAGFPLLLAVVFPVGQPVFPHRRIQRAVMRRYAVVRCALEDVELFDLRRDGCDRLDAGRTSADDADPLACEVGVIGPGGRAQRLALEISGTRNVRCFRSRETARRHDTVSCLDGLALVRHDPP